MELYWIFSYSEKEWQEASLNLDNIFSKICSPYHSNVAKLFSVFLLVRIYLLSLKATHVWKYRFKASNFKFEIYKPHEKNE
jgi:hypothetical protein